MVGEDDDPMTCDSNRVFFFPPLFDVALRPSDIFLDDCFMPYFSLLLFSSLPLRYVR